MARQRIDRVELRTTETGYAFTVGARDYHIRFDAGVWVLDAFPREATGDDGGVGGGLAESVEFESMEEGLNWVLEGG